MPLEPSAALLASQALPQGLDAIFVIHATRFVERRRFIEAQMAGLGLPYEFVLDFDIPAIPEDLRQRLFRGDKLSPAQQSCALKHWQAHRLIVERGLSRVLILEDDVIFSAQFLPALNGLMKEEVALGDPHVTFLGCGGHYYVPHEQIRAGQWLYPRNQGKFADSYIVSQATVQRRLDWIEANGITLPIDHTFEHIDRTLATPMFWLEPPVVEQGSHNGKFSSALDKSHPLWFQALQFRWKKLWRRRRHG
ncbi:MAG: glycosyltransferase family 25 protein [Polaromonas sp.]|uniref:glycosyltransferase family 25 protein n=1 Tax=Polaromonas sp. TaxID=1869339 RepID=UPI0018118C7C|nr:glycosyltransferase family 25 protein [Polaromonas sp.]MBA3594201.1 glycosyltransferase family 25 protein [Polaromonas sp.]